MELKGRVAVVTGGASGMGRATARRLVDEGMRVCALDIQGDALREVTEPIGALAVECDVSKPEQVDAAFARCFEELGSVDLAFLNAGVGLRWSGDIGEMDLKDYELSVGVNLHGVVYGARAAVRAMRQRSDPEAECALIATSSIAGIDPFHPDPIYTIGKHGVVGLMRAIAPNLAAEGISTHTICPDTTDTGMLGDGVRKWFEKSGLTVMPAEEIANSVVIVATGPMDLAGSCWVCHPGQPPKRFEFNNVPGPHNVLNVHR